jgi:hypothetical protein
LGRGRLHHPQHQNDRLRRRPRPHRPRLHVPAPARQTKLEDGTFNYNIEPRHLRRYFYYKNAWIEYQFVSVNEKNEILGRTQLYDRILSLAKCGL